MVAMNAHIRLGPDVPEAEMLDRLSDALTSCRPPLDPDSGLIIDAIRERRLSAVEETDMRAVGAIFAAVDSLPPAQGWIIDEILQEMKRSEFDVESLVGSYETPSSGELLDPAVDELGFLVRAAVIEERPGERSVTVDQWKAEREGLRVLAELCIAFAELADPEIRAAVADDCREVIALRMSFDFRR